MTQDDDIDYPICCPRCGRPIAPNDVNDSVCRCIVGYPTIDDDNADYDLIGQDEYEESFDLNPSQSDITDEQVAALDELEACASSYDDRQFKAIDKSKVEIEPKKIIEATVDSFDRARTSRNKTNIYLPKPAGAVKLTNS